MPQENDQPVAPCALPVLEENIPAFLKGRKQWVLWLYTWDASKTDRETGQRGKWDKPPWRVGFRYKASSTDPKSWTLYERAIEAYRTSGCSGIGYVVSGEPGDVVGIDLDHCRDPATGIIAEWATVIVRRFGSYTEVSPSGKGLRILLLSAQPPRSRRRDKVEYYRDGRYLTITGHKLAESPPHLVDCTAPLAAWVTEQFGDSPDTPLLPFLPPQIGDLDEAAAEGYRLLDDEVLRMARASKHGASFRLLFDYGNLAECEGDASKGDWKLCRQLAFWFRNDAAAIDRLFRRSALMRVKWDQKRGPASYGARTIGKIIATQTKVYDPDFGSAVLRPPAAAAGAGEGNGAADGGEAMNRVTNGGGSPPANPGQPVAAEEEPEDRRRRLLEVVRRRLSFLEKIDDGQGNVAYRVWRECPPVLDIKQIGTDEPEFAITFLIGEEEMEIEVGDDLHNQKLVKKAVQKTGFSLCGWKTVEWAKTVQHMLDVLRVVPTTPERIVTLEFVSRLLITDCMMGAEAGGIPFERYVSDVTPGMAGFVDEQGGIYLSSKAAASAWSLEFQENITQRAMGLRLRRCGFVNQRIQSRIGNGEIIKRWLWGISRLDFDARTEEANQWRHAS